MLGKHLGSVILAVSVSGTSFVAMAAELRAPAGYYHAVQHKNTSKFDCPTPPAPYTGDLIFPSKYEGDGPSKDTLNKSAEQRYKSATASIREFEKGIVKLSETVIKKGKADAPMQCMVHWYKAWIDADALTTNQTNSIGKAVRKWALAASATAWMRVKLAQASPFQRLPKEDIARIEKWMQTLARLTEDDYRNRKADKANNHDYWAAWAVMATAVILDDKAMFDRSADVYQLAMTQIDAEGFLPNELARQTRALGYHQFAMQPLAMMHVFLVANAHPAADFRKEKFLQLSEHVLQGLENPAVFADKAAHKQVTDNLTDCSSLAWIEPLYTAFPLKEMKPYLSRCRPMLSTRMGGNMTVLFATLNANN